MTTRNSTLDIAKGLGMVLVVFGHNWVVSHAPGEMFRVIFSFHMPLFFFLSGVFLRATGSFGAFLWSKADALLKPYFATLLVAALFHVGLAYMKTKSLELDGWTSLKGALYGTGSTLEWVPLWFLPHLLVCNGVAFWVVRSTLSTKLLLAMAAICLFTGVALLSTSELPWSMDLLPTTLPFLIMGYALRAPASSITFDKRHFSAAVVLFGLLHYFFDETINFNFRQYGFFPVATAQAFLGIYICLAASAYIGSMKTSGFAVRAIRYIGTGSLFLLLFHYFFQEKVFNLVLRTSNSVAMAAVFGFLAGMVVPLLLWEWAKRNRYLTAVFIPRQRATSIRG